MSISGEREAKTDLWAMDWEFSREVEEDAEENEEAQPENDKAEDDSIDELSESFAAFIPFVDVEDVVYCGAFGRGGAFAICVPMGG